MSLVGSSDQYLAALLWVVIGFQMLFLLQISNQTTLTGLVAGALAVPFLVGMVHLIVGAVDAGEDHASD